MRPTGVVSKKVTGARTSVASVRRWITREARRQEVRLVTARTLDRHCKWEAGGRGDGWKA